MSLSSLLLGSLSSRGGPVKNIDTELDDIFRSSVRAIDETSNYDLTIPTGFYTSET
jgi:hypothetical protein